MPTVPSSIWVVTCHNALCKWLLTHSLHICICVGIDTMSSVADPGFPRDRAPTLGGRGGADIRFCQIFPKHHKIERIWTPRGTRVPHAPLDPPLVMAHLQCWRQISVDLCIRIPVLDISREYWSETVSVQCEMLSLVQRCHRVRNLSPSPYLSPSPAM